MSASTRDADVLIAGGGCAGLSLAVHLLESGPQEQTVRVIEPRTSYGRDRTWCFWNTERHPFETCVAHSYPGWRVSTHQGSTDIQGCSYRYQYLPSDRFYQAALERLDADPRVDVELGTEVHGLQDHGMWVEVQTSRGALRCGRVFDSRPPPHWEVASDEPSLLQHFRGWFVRCEREVFDPSTAILMDLRVDQSAGVHFVYVLPTSPHEALVEDTYFSEAPFATEAYQRTLAHYLEYTLQASAYDVLAEEAGVLPMTAQDPMPSPSPRVHRIGLLGGAAKPSTGYAFMAIQRHSAAIARSLHHSDSFAFPSYRDRRVQMLDRIFLSYLKKNPQSGPDVFRRMFRSASPDAVVRFLSECASWRDALQVMATMPKKPFTEETWRTGLRWVRKAR